MCSAGASAGPKPTYMYAETIYIDRQTDRQGHVEYVRRLALLAIIHVHVHNTCMYSIILYTYMYMYICSLFFSIESQLILPQIKHENLHIIEISTACKGHTCTSSCTCIYNVHLYVMWENCLGCSMWLYSQGRHVNITSLVPRLSLLPRNNSMYDL